MSQENEIRLNLIRDILGEKQNSSRLFVQYMTASRKYGSLDILHMREAHFIMAVGLGEGKTMSELAEQMSVTHGAVSQTASRLERKGYILRQRDGPDRRQILVTLTEQGREFYRSHLEYDNNRFSAIDREYLSHFTTDQLRLFLEYEAAMSACFAQSSNEESE